jgi:hypothetical protein
MHLSDRHRSFLIIEESVFAGLINVVINGGFVWLLMRSEAAIPLWGDPCIGTDLLATGFLLPFITWLIVSPLVRRQVKAGKLPALEPDQIRPLGLHRRSAFARGPRRGALHRLRPLVDLARPRARPDRRAGRSGRVGRRSAPSDGSSKRAHPLGAFDRPSPGTRSPDTS